MHLFRAHEPWCLLLAAVITGPCIEFYEQKCHEAFSHADVAPAALEWSTLPTPPHPPFRPPPFDKERLPHTCHLPPCLPHVMICCLRPVLEGASRLAPRSHDAPFLQGFSFAPTRGPGLLRSVIRGFAQDGPRSSSQQQRQRPQTGNKNSSNWGNNKVEEVGEREGKHRRWDTHARIMQRQWQWQPPRAPFSPVEALSVSVLRAL